MSKELHPGLFQDQKLSFDPTPEMDMGLLHQLTETRRLESKLGAAFNQLAHKWEELDKTLNFKVEKTLQKFAQMEMRIETMNTDLQTKHSQLSGKVTEKNLNEIKTQALIDRHNQLVHQFEQRLHQLQKTIDDQEMELMNYKTALDDAKKEIARLKRF